MARGLDPVWPLLAHVIRFPGIAKLNSGSVEVKSLFDVHFYKKLPIPEIVPNSMASTAHLLLPGQLCRACRAEENLLDDLNSVEHHVSCH